MSETRPNIIFIMTDQQRYDTIKALGYPYMHTPTLDKLVVEGTVFTQCHVAGASCTPARAALFKGLYPHTTGILQNGNLWRRTWLERFQAAGYMTVNLGKMHTEPMDTPAGFDERYTVENKERFRPEAGINRDYIDEWDRALGYRGKRRPTRDFYGQLPNYAQALGAFEWPYEPELHPDNFTGDLALWWIGHKPVTQPIFMQIGFPGPHPPYDPTKDEVGRYLDQDLPIQSLADGELTRQPTPLQAQRRITGEVGADAVIFRADASMADRKRQRAYYLANQTMIDQKIGQILKRLRERGYLDNAVVVFTSDHGDCLGDHGLNHKWNGYDQVTRVPLIVWSPGRVPAGKTVDGLVQQQDIASYLFQVAGIKQPPGLEIEDLSPALTGGEFTGRDAVYCENAKEKRMCAAHLSVMRTEEWKLVHYFDAESGQLFDLKNDPLELDDLWNDSGTAPMKRELLEHFYRWRMHSAIATSDWASEVR